MYKDIWSHRSSSITHKSGGWCKIFNVNEALITAKVRSAIGNKKDLPKWNQSSMWGRIFHWKLKFWSSRAERMTSRREMAQNNQAIFVNRYEPKSSLDFHTILKHVLSGSQQQQQKKLQTWSRLLCFIRPNYDAWLCIQRLCPFNLHIVSATHSVTYKLKILQNSPVEICLSLTSSHFITSSSESIRDWSQ